MRELLLLFLITCISFGFFFFLFRFVFYEYFLDSWRESLEKGNLCCYYTLSKEKRLSVITDIQHGKAEVTAHVNHGVLEFNSFWIDLEELYPTTFW